METDKQLSRRDFLKVVGAVAGATVLGALTKDAQGDNPQDITPPDYSFEPFQVPSETPGVNTQTETTIVEFPKPRIEPKLSPAEIRDQQVKKELSNIKKIMTKNINVFGKKRIEDVNIYYPIYRATADKFKIPWYLIFIVHKAETGASAGKRGFAPDSYYKGAMQLDPMWTGQFMDSASKGLKYLSKLPQRHPDDWKNIATGAKLLSRNFMKYKKLGTDKAVLNALLLYSAEGPAQIRFKTFLKYEELFPAGKKKNKNTNTNTALRRAS